MKWLCDQAYSKIGKGEATKQHVGRPMKCGRGENGRYYQRVYKCSREAKHEVKYNIDDVTSIGVTDDLWFVGDVAMRAKECSNV